MTPPTQQAAGVAVDAANPPGGAVATAAEHLAELTRALATHDSVVGVAQTVVDAAVREVPGAQYAAITIVDRGGAHTPAASHDLGVRVDALQYRTQQGPCLEATHTSRMVRCDDLTADPRWPRFTGAAVAEGVRSVVSFPLFTAAATIGALNLYAGAARVLSAESEQAGFLLAAHATAAMVTTRKSANLQNALSNRDVIGQAKGILMERHKISADAAFALLVTTSQLSSIKLHEIATRLAETGELPTPRR